MSDIEFNATQETREQVVESAASEALSPPHAWSPFDLPVTAEVTSNDVPLPGCWDARFVIPN